MQMEFQAKGIKELEKTFSKLPKTARRKVFRVALRRGAAVVRKAAVENVKAIATQEPTGTLARNIAQYSARDTKDGKMRQVIQVRRKAVHPTKRRGGKKGQDGKQRVAEYAAVLEYGKQNQPPRSWLRKAAREKVGEVLQLMAQDVRQRMIDAIMEARR